MMRLDELEWQTDKRATGEPFDYVTVGRLSINRFANGTKYSLIIFGKPFHYIPDIGPLELQCILLKELEILNGLQQE